MTTVIVYSVFSVRPEMTVEESLADRRWDSDCVELTGVTYTYMPADKQNS